MTTRPIETIRDGKLSASIWQNQSEKGVFYSVTFERVYTGEDGNAKSATSFSGSELLRISHLARRAYDRANKLREALK